MSWSGILPTPLLLPFIYSTPITKPNTHRKGDRRSVFEILEQNFYYCRINIEAVLNPYIQKCKANEYWMISHNLIVETDKPHSCIF